MEYEDFDIEECKRQIGEGMAEILKTSPNAAPVLEELAKLISIAEDPDAYVKNQKVEVPGVGVYELTAGPAPMRTGYALMVCLTLEGNPHKIGPAQISLHKTLAQATRAMEEYAIEVERTHPTILIDAPTGIRYEKDGYFTPYDAEFPDLGPWSPLLDVMDLLTGEEEE